MKWLLVTLFSLQLHGAPHKGVVYLQSTFGHVHKNTSKHSGSLSTIACGHPLKLLGDSANEDGWLYVAMANKKGFVHESLFSQKRPNCFQNRFPRFFDKFELDVSQMYYWGKLYDHFVMEKTQVR